MQHQRYTDILYCCMIFRAWLALRTFWVRYHTLQRSCVMLPSRSLYQLYPAWHGCHWELRFHSMSGESLPTLQPQKEGSLRQRYLHFKCLNRLVIQAPFVSGVFVSGRVISWEKLSFVRMWYRNQKDKTSDILEVREVILPRRIE